MVRVDSIKCTGCGHCVDVCPQKAITIDSDVAVINQELCVDCGICGATCPSRAIYEVAPVYAEQWKGGNDVPNGFGRGRAFGRGFGAGMGFGFRGTSPPWPYVGIGRGGLPRCGYFLSGAGAPLPWPYQQPTTYGAPPTYGYGPMAGSMTEEDELNYLKDQAEAVKRQLEQIDSRMHELEAEK